MTAELELPAGSAPNSGLRPYLAAFTLQSFGWGVLLLVFSFGSFSSANSALDVAATGAFIAAPTLILMPISARLVRRFPARQLNVAILLIDFVLYLSLAVYTEIYGESLQLLFVAAALTGILYVAMYVPAWSNLVRTAVPPEQLSDLNLRLISVKSAGQVVGLVTSGLLLAVVGYSGLFLICGLTFLPLAWASARMPLTGAGSVAEPSESSSLIVALRELWASKLMRSSFVLMGVLIFAAWPLMVLLPPVAGYMFPESQLALSFLMAMFFIGSALVSPMIKLRINGLKGTRKMLVSAERHSWPRRLLPLVSVAIALLALTAHVEPALLGLVLTGLLLIPAGLLLGVLGVMTTSLVQREISPASAAMGLTAYVIVVEIGTSIGSLTAAAIADSIGVFIVLVGLGALGIIATIWIVSNRYFVPVSDMVAETFVPPELMPKLQSRPADT
ncbi:unannotated protein [freshwater metagenome]|uniref:Unannotated protein n=1 Tax=freshwater metagenome TaxID=449393 RepID=A0A6J5ZUP4_9ZZZZ|nr:MFS transporter [Actinomycetota bacterium]